jgi:predicted acyl esterase
VTLRRLLASRAGRTGAIALVGILAWQGWLAQQAAVKTPPDLGAYVSERGTVDLRVTLRFPPERFHVLMFQRFGRVSGIEGDTIEVRGVSPRRVREIARFYWVKTIVPFRD